MGVRVQKVQKVHRVQRVVVGGFAASFFENFYNRPAGEEKPPKAVRKAMNPKVKAELN